MIENVGFTKPFGISMKIAPHKKAALENPARLFI